jgi:hypothetical protein
MARESQVAAPARLQNDMSWIFAEIGPWAALGISALLLVVLAAPIAAVFVVMLSATDETVEGAIEDVARFIELTERARAVVPPGLHLLDPSKGAETAAAVNRFISIKAEARRALWASSSRGERIYGDALPARSAPSQHPPDADNTA